MMRGIDISSWQTGMDVANVIKKNELDFVICKATEGMGLVDSVCDRFIQETKRLGKCYGFYHFARNHDPGQEAEYFYNHTRNYFGEGIPVLDIEDSAIPDWSAYAKAFADRIHRLSSIWPMIYVSAGSCWRFSDNDTFKHCALWVAGYPRKIPYWHNLLMSEFDYSIYPWDQASAWQFSGTGDIKGYNGNVDLDIAFMDSSAWNKIAKGDISSANPAKDSLFVTACKVIAGLYGNGEARRKTLEANGYDYDAVQKLVGELIERHS